MADGALTIPATTHDVAQALLVDPEAFVDVLDVMAGAPLSVLAVFVRRVGDSLLGEGSEAAIPEFLRALAVEIEQAQARGQQVAVAAEGAVRSVKAGLL
jgi:hypothetical protein